MAKPTCFHYRISKHYLNVRFDDDNHVLQEVLGLVIPVYCWNLHLNAILPKFELRDENMGRLYQDFLASIDSLPYPICVFLILLTAKLIKGGLYRCIHESHNNSVDQLLYRLLK